MVAYIEIASAVVSGRNAAQICLPKVQSFVEIRPADPVNGGLGRTSESLPICTAYDQINCALQEQAPLTV